jgi:GT2 family glycosyltransferase
VSERVAAVVAAHDRVASLETLFAALDEQTRRPDELVVLDSDATPEVRALLERVEAAGARIVRLGENGGSAGGFAAGMNAVGRDGRSTLAWTLHDDAIPARDCLELLSTGSGAERLRVATMLAAKIVSVPVGATVEGLARREWKRDRARPNDSAQYLLFEKR